MTKPFLPFGILPGHWGLRGMTREIAKAEYELTGIDLEKALADIKLRSEPAKLKMELARIELAHGAISEREFAEIEAKETLTGIDLAIKLLEIEFKYSGTMTENEFNKKIANLKDEPFICVVKSEFDASMGINGVAFEFDWNERWIKDLVAAGYSGSNEDELIQKWFEDLCRSVLLDSADIHDAVPFNSSRTFSTSDGRTFKG